MAALSRSDDFKTCSLNDYGAKSLCLTQQSKTVILTDIYMSLRVNASSSTDSNDYFKVTWQTSD